jgi:hypothetical protein
MTELVKFAVDPNRLTDLALRTLVVASIPIYYNDPQKVLDLTRDERLSALKGASSLSTKPCTVENLKAIYGRNELLDLCKNLLDPKPTYLDSELKDELAELLEAEFAVERKLVQFAGIDVSALGEEALKVYARGNNSILGVPKMISYVIDYKFDLSDCATMRLDDCASILKSFILYKDTGLPTVSHYTKKQILDALAKERPDTEEVFYTGSWKANSRFLARL